MALPQVERLRAENWRSHSYIVSRLGALQSMENQLAAQENRPAVQVGVIPGEKRRLGSDGQPVLRGYFDKESGENGSIAVDPALLENDEPYQAVETYFHEARHAYQHHVAYHPEEHPEAGKDQAELWRMNDEAYIGEEDINYSGGEIKYGHYFGQPLEVDARDVGRQRTETLYAEQFQDLEGYEHHRQVEEELNSKLDQKSRDEVGENYQEEALKQVEMKYQFLQEEKAEEMVGQSTAQGEEAVPEIGEAAGEAAIPEYVTAQAAAGEAEATGEVLSEAGEESLAVSSEAPEQAAEGESESNEESYAYGYGY